MSHKKLWIQLFSHCLCESSRAVSRNWSRRRKTLNSNQNWRGNGSARYSYWRHAPDNVPKTKPDFEKVSPFCQWLRSFSIKSQIFRVSIIIYWRVFQGLAMFCLNNGFKRIYLRNLDLLCHKHKSFLDWLAKIYFGDDTARSKICIGLYSCAREVSKKSLGWIEFIPPCVNMTFVLYSHP